MVEYVNQVLKRIRSPLAEMAVIVGIMLWLGVGTPCVVFKIAPITFRRNNHVPEEMKREQARQDCKAWVKAAEMYKSKYGDYPPNLETLTQRGQDGSDAFMEVKQLVDPWGHQYMYQFPGHKATGKPDVYSWGPRVNDPKGIIGNWQ